MFQVARLPRFRLRQALFLASTIPFPHSAAWIHTSKSDIRGRLLSVSAAAAEDDIRDHILRESSDDDRPILSKSLDWLQCSVIGLNLCPFAEKALIRKRLTMEVVHGSDQVNILARVLSECLVRQKRKGTSLIICPDLYPSNFLAFLEVYNMVQDGVLVDYNLNSHLQVAPFHPYFEFEGSGDGIENYTNRSPFPIFHILREEEVSIAVNSMSGDASKVWKRNIRLLEELEDRIGREETEKFIGGDIVDNAAMEEIEKILKELRKA